MIDTCTLTGLDDRTDLGRVEALCAEYPFLEFGILLSRTPGDKDPRYPSWDALVSMVERLAGKAHLALHVCGRAVGEFVEGADDIDGLVSIGINRVQLNFMLRRSPFGIADLDAAIARSTVSVITQHTVTNDVLAYALKAANHHVLFDTSGGRGVEIAECRPPFTGKYTGYAGGMGPENVKEMASRVAAVSGGTPVWIDMESRLRTDGYLDMDRCAAVAAAVSPMVSSGNSGA